MLCPKCQVQIVREYRKGGHILWKCYLCGYTVITQEAIDAQKADDSKGNSSSPQEHLQGPDKQD